MRHRFQRERRALLFAGAASAPFVFSAHPSSAGDAGFGAFLEGVRADARRAGISAGTVSRAFAGLQPNPRVLELDRFQPEGPGMTWEEYRERQVSPTRVENG